MERLWTPWRLAYVTEASIVTPACIFCDALAHLDTEPLVVHRGQAAFVLLNKYPYNNGHLMVVPHRHVGWLADLTEAELAEFMTLTQHAEKALHAYQQHLMEIHRMEAVGRMTAGIAHDFRGIIGAALGFAELMRRVPQLPSQADHYAQRITDALERGRELTHQLMSFGKDDAVTPRVLDVRELLETLGNMFRVMLGNAIGEFLKKPGVEAGIFGLILVLVILLEPLGMYGRWLKIKLFFSTFPMYKASTFRRQKSYMRSERLR